MDIGKRPLENRRCSAPDEIGDDERKYGELVFR